MTRKSLHDSEVRAIIAALAELYFRTGSVNALTQLLNEQLEGPGKHVRLYANRVHALLSDDPARGVNARTLEAVEAAVKASPPDPDMSSTLGRREDLRAKVLRRVPSPSSPASNAAVKTWAAEIDCPPAVVRLLLSQPIGVESQSAAQSSPGRSRPPRRTPDWSFQDDAYRRCRRALSTRPGRRIGLVIPTGGGKTRTALRIATGELHDSHSTTSKVIWVTHRRQLHRQAHRELQEMITEGTKELPPESMRLLSSRFQFVMLSNLRRVLDENRGQIALVIVDEAHRAAAASYTPLFEQEPAVSALLLTATPIRTDGRSIGADEIAYSITYRELFDAGVIVEPTFEPPLQYSWMRPEDLPDLADYLLDNADDRFTKTLVVVPTVERVVLLYDVLVDQLDGRDGHVLDRNDLGYVHGTGSSTGRDTTEFLDEFQARPRGILIATASMLGEGFNDKNINAVVVTYPSTSLLQLMQCAGRCLRSGPGKADAYIVQACDSTVAYHYEQRWLYQEISDVLHPQLVDITYETADVLRSTITTTLEQHNVELSAAARVMAQLDGVHAGERCRLLLTGLPYAGDASAFKTEATWNAVLETEANSIQFRSLFNVFCEHNATTNDIPAFLDARVPSGQLSPHERKRYIEMMLAMEYARREIQREPYQDRDARPYQPNVGTTWLKYVTFIAASEIPHALDDFLALCVNRDRLMNQYIVQPAIWTEAVRIELPVGGSVGFLLTESQSNKLSEYREQLRLELLQAPPADGYSVVAAWQHRLDATGLPLLVVNRIDQLISESRYAAQALGLAPKGLASSGDEA